MSYFISLLNLAALFGAIAALQALLLNRIGLAFAAMNAFLGLGAYAMATLKPAPGASAAFLAAAVLLAIAMAYLSNRLRHDYYLLATLAVLECVGAVVSVIPMLGGREGLPLASSSRLGGADFEIDMLLPIGTVLALVLGVCWFVLGSAAGIAIDRFRENPDTASRWFPVNRLRVFAVVATTALAVGVGAVYVMYQGRVTPRVFSIDLAILLLMFTVLAGKRPILASAAALLYWVLPYFGANLLPLSRQGAADGVRLAWGVLVVLAVIVPATVERRRMAQLRPKEEDNGVTAY